MKKKNFLLSILIFAVIAISSVFLFTACSGMALDLNDLYKLEYQGVNGNGQATVVFDEQNFYAAIRTLMLKKHLSEPDATDLLSRMQFDMQPKYGLSNGDPVAVSISYDGEGFQKAGVTPLNTQRIFTVEGLTEGTPEDVFDGLNVTFEGISPYISYQVDTSGCSEFTRNYVRFEAAPDMGPNLKNGQSLTLQAICDIRDQAQQGIAITQTEKTFAVPQSLAYLTEISGSDADALQKEALGVLGEWAVSSEGSSGFLNMELDTEFFGVADRQVMEEDFLVLKNPDVYSNITKQGMPVYNQYIVFVDYTIAVAPVDVQRVYATASLSNIYRDESGAIHWEEDSLVIDTNDDAQALKQQILTSRGREYTITPVKARPAEESPVPAQNSTAFDENGFLFPGSDTKLLTAQDLSALNPQDGYSRLDLLGFARNEIYARHGNAFTKEVYQNHYSQYGWYNSLSKHKVENDELSEIELKNLDLIMAAEQAEPT